MDPRHAGTAVKQASAGAAGAGGVVGREVVAACGLSTVPALGASSLARIAREFGSLSGALEEGARAIVRANARLKLRREALDYLGRDPDLEELGLWALNAAQAAGARVLLLADQGYPRRLREIAHPPPLLYLRGHLDPEARRVAVVGSREANENGLALARSLGEGLARAGVTVVSGGARGVDAAAHEGALWGAVASVAVLGCGIDVSYPPENGELFERLARGPGALVSEFAPGTQPLPPNFPRRNRTIAGLSDAVVVVRAALQSGALITANHAAHEGRPLFAVPGDPGERSAQGSNELLRVPQVKAVTSAVEVLEALGWPVPEGLRLPQQADAGQADPGFPAGPPSNPAGAGKEERLPDQASLRLWQLLDERTPSHVDELAALARLSAPEVLGRLADLELKGMCLQRPGKYFLRR